MRLHLSPRSLSAYHKPSLAHLTPTIPLPTFHPSSPVNLAPSPLAHFPLPIFHLPFLAHHSTKHPKNTYHPSYLAHLSPTFPCPSSTHLCVNFSFQLLSYRLIAISSINHLQSPFII